MTVQADWILLKNARLGYVAAQKFPHLVKGRGCVGERLQALRRNLACLAGLGCAEKTNFCADIVVLAQACYYPRDKPFYSNNKRTCTHVGEDNFVFYCRRLNTRISRHCFVSTSRRYDS